MKAKKYFNLRLGNPKQNGSIIELDTKEKLENKLKDFINSFVGKENNLQFRLTKKTKNENFYEVEIPEMKLGPGAYAPALCCMCPPGWDKTGEDIVKLVLTKEKLKPYKPKSKKGKKVYIDEITRQKAKDMKEDEFYHSMTILYILGY